MRDVLGPLRVEHLSPLHGLEVVRQDPPASSASFSATYVGPAGWAYDPAGLEGTARLVSQVVTSAAGPYNRVALARRLDRAGASLSHQCAPESAEMTIWGPADVWVELLEILALVVRQPRFDVSDVQRARRQLHERQLRGQTQPGARAERELLQRMFPHGHPYRETGVGSARALGKITKGSLVRFHRERFSGEGGIVVVTARAKGPAVEKAVKRQFDGMARLAGPPPRIPTGGRPAAGTTRIELPGRSQVEVRLGGPALPRSDPRYFAALLANEVLGGRPLLSRLFQKLRERGGLAYHASSSLEAMRWGGYWVAQAGTGVDRWPKVLEALERELRALRRAAPSDKELNLVRESAIGGLVLSLESTAEAHELAVEAAYHHLPSDHWIRWASALRAVKPRDVLAAAEEVLGGSGEAAVVAGPLRAG